jgi:2-polyprenyl-3-methyl-5-hydroxy-6-metoxy-1,4-benzoquinol methylase
MISLIIIAIIVIIIIFFLLRYYVYNKLFVYKSIDAFNEPLNLDLDNMYNEYLNNKKQKKILDDYSKVNLEDTGDSYNICLVRKYPLSHPTDATIELADIKDGMHILDAGCGIGMVSIYMCNKFPNLRSSCIVNTEKLYNIVTNNINKYNLADRIKVYIIDFDYLTKPITNYYYDRIIFLESIDYSINRKKLIKSCYKLLNKGGKLFIKSPQFYNNLNKKYYNDINGLINKWGYNFSNISSLLNDVNKSPFSDIKYISISSLKCMCFYNISDIFKLLKFCMKNKEMLFIRKMDIIANLKGSNTFILATK